MGQHIGKRIYRFVFEAGVMVFRPLGLVRAHLQTERIKIEGELGPTLEEQVLEDSLLEDNPAAEPLQPPAMLPELE